MMEKKMTELLLSKCAMFAQDYEDYKKGKLTREIIDIWTQNLTAMGAPEEALAFATGNGEADEESQQIYSSKIKKWRDENFKCYSCIKCGCKEEEIQQCHKKLSYNRDKGKILSGFLSG